jgi:hypothetical protein
MSSRAWGLFVVNDVRMFGLYLCRVWRNSKEPSKIRLITGYRLPARVLYVDCGGSPTSYPVKTQHDEDGGNMIIL